LTYLIADHPVKSIDTIYINGAVVDSVVGVTKYTGQAGSQHPTWPNKAIIVINKLFGPTTVVDITPTGQSSSNFNTPANWVNGNQSDYAYTNMINAYVNATFSDNTIFGTIISQRVNVKVTCGTQIIWSIYIGSTKMYTATSVGFTVILRQKSAGNVNDAVQLHCDYQASGIFYTAGSVSGKKSPIYRMRQMDRTRNLFC